VPSPATAASTAAPVARAAAPAAAVPSASALGAETGGRRNLVHKTHRTHTDIPLTQVCMHIFKLCLLYMFFTTQTQNKHKTKKMSGDIEATHRCVRSSPSGCSSRSSSSHIHT
jgi:hypothetical protein